MGKEYNQFRVVERLCTSFRKLRVEGFILSMILTTSSNT